MPKQNPEIETQLKKLGDHLRKGWAKQHTPSEKNLQVVRDAVREQWQKEREQVREKEAAPAPEPEKTQEREPDEPDRD